MKLISWNIQWSRGVDGKVDPQRIVADARKLGDFDVLCLQEVAANFPSLAGSAGENQFEIFADLLSRYPVLRVLRHQLPWPVDADVISMPRVLLEVTLDTPLGPVRVMNTHLEYYSQLQRKQQVEAIRNYHAETSLRALRSRVCETGPSPYHAFAQTSKVILTGDFNFRPEDPLHERLQEKLEPGVPRLVDTWEYLNGNQPHPHNVGVYDREQWEEAFACDFIFASEDLLPHVRTFKIDGKTKASDHQPQLLELA